MADNILEIDDLETVQPVESQSNIANSDEGMEIRTWHKDTVALILALVIAVCGFGMLLLLSVPLLAVLLSVLGIDLPGVDTVAQWFSSGYKGLILAVALAVIGLLSFLALRFRVRHNALLYTAAGCPQCQEHELIRVRRRKTDRVIARLGIPVRRYVCRNCSWGGLRIGGPLPNVETDQKVKAEDLFLANDLGIQPGETPASKNG